MGTGESLNQEKTPGGERTSLHLKNVRSAECYKGRWYCILSILLDK